MTFEYTTKTEANTFIRVYNSIPTNSANWAKLVREEPGVYVVELVSL